MKISATTTTMKITHEGSRVKLRELQTMGYAGPGWSRERIALGAPGRPWGSILGRLVESGPSEGFTIPSLLSLLLAIAKPHSSSIVARHKHQYVQPPLTHTFEVRAAKAAQHKPFLRRPGNTFPKASTSIYHCKDKAQPAKGSVREQYSHVFPGLWLWASL